MVWEPVGASVRLAISCTPSVYTSVNASHTLAETLAETSVEVEEASADTGISE
jgi:hypothetical protein